MKKMKTRFENRILTAALCAIFFCAVQASQALVPRVVISTNIVTGEVSTNFSLCTAGSEAPRWQTTKASGPRAWLFALRWELQDDAQYGVPYLVRNDRPTLIISGALLLALVWIVLRSFRCRRAVQVARSGLENIPTCRRAGHYVATPLLRTLLAAPAAGAAVHYQILKSFSRNDGANPCAGLIMDRDGVILGTTTSGGSNGFGTIFTLRNDGSDYRLLHHFTGYSGGVGDMPLTPGLIVGSDGALYGTTAAELFKLNRDGSGYAVLQYFG